jgi:hypothetical protein
MTHKLPNPQLPRRTVGHKRQRQLTLGRLVAKFNFAFPAFCEMRLFFRKRWRLSQDFRSLKDCGRLVALEKRIEFERSQWQFR